MANEEALCTFWQHWILGLGHRWSGTIVFFLLDCMYIWPLVLTAVPGLLGTASRLYDLQLIFTTKCK